MLIRINSRINGTRKGAERGLNTFVPMKVYVTRSGAKPKSESRI
jgi:hypothetical protein